MAIAVNLDDAATKTPTNLVTLWAADTLQARMIQFWQQALPLFPESDPNSHPLANWLVLIASFAPSILPSNYPAGQGTNGTIVTLEISIDYVYRLCKFGSSYPFLTLDQNTGLLAAYNAAFA